MPLGENPGQDDETPPEHSRIYTYAKQRFDDGYRLDHDTMNVWVILGYTIPSLPKSFEKLKPLRHYENYVRHIDQTHGENGEYAALLMEKSDPRAVAAFDALVDEFNADLDRIKNERDYETAKKFLTKAKELIYSKK